MHCFQKIHFNIINLLVQVIIFFSPIFSTTTSAQFIFRSKKPISTNRALIDKYEGNQLKDSIPFSNIIIVDSRYDTTGLGFYLDGYLVLNNVSALAGLQQTMDKYYHPICQADKDTLIIQLEKLSIQDVVLRDTNFALTAGYVKAKLYRGRKNAFSYFGSMDTLFQEKYSYEHYNYHKNGKHSNYEYWDFYLLRLYEAVIKKASATSDTFHS